MRIRLIKICSLLPTAGSAGLPIQRAGYTQGVFAGHMGVNHRGLHTGMTQQFLDGANITAGLQQVSP